MARSVNLTKAAYDAAVRRAQKEDAAKPRVRTVEYVSGREPGRDALKLQLRNDVELAIPIGLIPGVDGASPARIRHVEIEGDGSYLRWPDLDVDHSVPTLLAEAIGITTASAIGRRGGAARSQAKAAAVRENGKKGGRPRTRATSKKKATRRPTTTRRRKTAKAAA